MKRILVAGCGDVGTRLALLLAERGHRTWGLKRSVGALPAPVTRIQADLAEPATLASLPRELDTIYYTAAADGPGEEAYKRAYKDGLENLLRALRFEPGRVWRLVFVSSTSVFSQSDGAWIDEDSPAEPAGYAGRILLEAERMAADTAPACCIVRLAGIYGPGRNRLIRLATSGQARCAAGVHGNRIHVQDAAGFLAHLDVLEHPEPIYIGVDDDPAPMCEVMRWLAERLGAQAPVVSRPEDVQTAARRSNKRCSNKRLRASGYDLHYPSYRQGYEALLAAS